MLNAFSILLGCEIGGEILRRIYSLPLPGPVIGMCFLALFLLRKHSALPHSLVSTAGVLLKYLGLLFVPAGVGVIANLSLIGAEWFPILVGLVGSTILSVLASSYVMRWFASRNQDSGGAKPLLNGNKMHGT
jgi:holin-like protein